ncbi:ATP-binding protein [Methylocystis echinoides]|uniref:hybrid sensor histidine kinase/response regulator n=1 Tax=Methylocystis echinoides TaxID=29468 RepID=UPI0034311799
MTALALLLLFSAGVLLTAAAFVAFRAHRRSVALDIEVAELRAAAAARRKAEAATVAKSRFLAVVSHEIRTPLNGVMGLAQLLGMTRLDAEQASYVEAIGDSSRALAQLIDDILDYSKLEAGRVALRRDSFAPAGLVESVVELLAPRAQAKGLEIASVVAPDAPREITGDPARLRQVLINLVGNAVNYTERGGVGVRLWRDGETLRIDVRDTGPGVPAAAREAIFEDFTQVDPSATRRQGGTGLGLAISRRLVALMGGSLLLAKSSSEGSTFSVALPAPRLGLATGASRPLQGQSALIVGGSRFEAPYIAETLQASGASATVATAPDAGLRLSKKEPFDAVIIDCALGADSVASLARAARAAGAGRLFLLFSPLERRAFGEAALRDFDGWLVKPVRRASLAARLARATVRQQAPIQTVEPIAMLDGLSVLVAEDNDVNALILTRSLEKLGARAARARDGAEALAMALHAIDGGAEAYDLIVMDLFMPELDGREAARRIRDAEFRARASRTPIIMLTASAQEDDSRAARRAGVDAYLTKPVELAALAATVEELRLTPCVNASIQPVACAPAGAMAPKPPDR